ncbi:MAG: CDC48 family AAA ATPase [Candidatus Hodarchaeales archaeon]|jgi:transitional endoplasmic reticulum ATPase
MSGEELVIKLRVKASFTRDVGKGIVKIPIRHLNRLGLLSGDIVEVEGDKKTTVIAEVAKEDGNFIRMDGTIRTNCDARLDEFVSIRVPLETEAAKSVLLVPTGKFIIKGAENFFKRELTGRPVNRGDVIRMKLMGRKIEYMIQKIEPDKDNLIVTDITEVILSKERLDREKETGYLIKLTYEDIGGLKEEIKRIREMIELPVRYPELFQKLGINPPKGLLLHGAPGTGKTLLARAVANETEANYFSFSGPELISRYYGGSEKKIRDIFKEAAKKPPAIIFIDEIDSIAPKRKDDSGEVERRVVAQLLSLMDGMEEVGEKSKIIVIGATNLVNSIDPALRRPGRFDREIELPVPNKRQRLEILLIHTRYMPLARDVNLIKLADLSHGFVGADIANLTKEAAMRSLRRIFPEIQWKEKGIELPPGVFTNLEVTMEDFKTAMFEIEPSAMREVYVEIPDVRWDEVGGLDKQVQALRELVEWPIKYPYLFEKAKTKPPRGTLLFGPPGVGKTLLVKALSNETKLNLISIKGSEMLSKWVGESERAIRETFRKAKQASPCIIFFDELDSVAPARGTNNNTGVTDRVVSALLTEIDGIEELSGVFVIAATNRPELIDSALTRAGRFDRLVYVPLPGEKAMKEIFEVHLQDKPISSDVSFEELVKVVEGYSGADIAAVCREASMDIIKSFIFEHLEGGKVNLSLEDLQKKLEETSFQITTESLENAIARHGIPNRGDNDIYQESVRFARENGLELT